MGLDVAAVVVMTEGDLKGFVGMRVKHSTSRRTCDNRFISFGFFYAKIMIDISKVHSELSKRTGDLSSKNQFIVIF